MSLLALPTTFPKQARGCLSFTAPTLEAPTCPRALRRICAARAFV